MRGNWKKTSILYHCMDKCYIYWSIEIFRFCLNVNSFNHGDGISMLAPRISEAVHQTVSVSSEGIECSIIDLLYTKYILYFWSFGVHELCTVVVYSSNCTGYWLTGSCHLVIGSTWCHKVSPRFLQVYQRG